MFHSITGRLSAKNPDTIHLLNNGIEWELSVSIQTLQQLPAIGEEVRVFTWVHHSEDQLKLYGFASSMEKRIFLELIKVDGLGPRVAIKLLSALTPIQILSALEQGDPNAISKAPGVGLKTAQKILLTLRGKLVLDEETKEVSANFRDIALSLVEMGFERKLVDQALKNVLSEISTEHLNSDEKEKEIFKRALVWLSTK